MKTHWIPFAAVLLAVSCLWAEEDIAAQRYYKSSKTKDVFAAPRRGFEKLFTPFRAASNFAERVDLPARVRDFFYNADYTAAVFPAFSFGGELGGTALGLDAFHRNLFQRGKVLRGGFLYRNSETLNAKATYEDPSIGGTPWRWRLKTDYRRDEDVEIYSRGEHLGIFTRSEDEGSYGLTRFDGEMELARRLGRFEAGLYGRGTRGHAETGKGGGVPPPATLRGFEEVVHLGGGGIQAQWDRRNHAERPSLGTFLRARGGIVGSPDQTDLGQDYRYTEYHTEALQFFTLFKPRRILALRATLDRVDPLNEGEIPFYDLPVLDKNHMARNFARGRFRDRGALAFNAEYRYPIWVSWDAYLFLDAGQTFGTYRQVRSNHLRYSEGFGIRFGSADKIFFNVVVGLGREKPQIGVDFSQVF
jgi:hypothetical protein